MKQITNTRKTVCIMANKLRKAGYSLSQAFKKAWRRIKLSMTIRAAGTTFSNRQEIIRFMKHFPLSSLSLTLEREPENQFDHNAIKIIVHIHDIHKKAIIGYIPKGLAKELSQVMDKGIPVKAKLMDILGGYGYKETMGVLVNVSV